MRVVLGISHLKLVLLFDFMPDYAPERLEIGTHPKNQVQEIAGVLFGVFFLLLFQLLQSYPAHTCINSHIEGLGYEGRHTGIFSESFADKLCLVLAIKITDHSGYPLHFEHHSDVWQLCKLYHQP